MKKVMHTFLGLVCVLCGLVLVSGASALTYQDGTDVQFTFNSTLSISLSDTDIVIGNLIPGQDDTSNAVDVVVNTNNLYGYTLTATVGSATKDYRDLRHTNGVASFASIDVDSDLSTLSGQSSSVWGYTTSTNGTTWSNFNGLPKYDDTTNTAELNVTDGAAADSTTSFKIGAFAAEGQLAGDYTNVINFKVVSNVGKTYIQDVTSATCPTEPTIVYDNRDEEEYTIQKLADNKCWLLDNLRLDLTDSNVQNNLTADTTNASNTTLNYLKNGGGSTSDKYAITGVANWTDGYVYSRPLIYAGLKDHIGLGGYEDGKYGIHYNYCAATAGSYCYGDGTSHGTSSGDATEDICPKGWRMPASLETANEYDILYELYSSDYELFVNALRIPLSGAYNNGLAYNQGESGGSWTSTYVWDDIMGSLYIDKTDVDVEAYDDRTLGCSVRCVAK